MFPRSGDHSSPIAPARALRRPTRTAEPPVESWDEAAVEPWTNSLSGNEASEPIYQSEREHRLYQR